MPYWCQSETLAMNRVQISTCNGFWLQRDAVCAARSVSSILHTEKSSSASCAFKASADSPRPLPSFQLDYSSRSRKARAHQRWGHSSYKPLQAAGAPRLERARLCATVWKGAGGHTSSINPQKSESSGSTLPGQLRRGFTHAIASRQSAAPRACTQTQTHRHTDTQTRRHTDTQTHKLSGLTSLHKCFRPDATRRAVPKKSQPGAPIDKYRFSW
jgi:hypothetical protein